MRSLIASFAAARQAHIRPGTLHEYVRLLRPLNPYPAATLTRGQIAALSLTRNQLVALKTLCRWAVSTDRLPADPTAGLKNPRPGQRDRVLSLDELAALWAATADGSHYSRIVRLLILTGARLNEIARLAWAEVKEDRLVIPAARTKNHRQHAFPLSQLALAQLPPHRATRSHLFGLRRSTGFSGFSKAKASLDRRLGLEPWTHHDLRRSFVTHCNELELAPPHIIEAFVNHQSGHKAGVAGVYNRAAYWPQRRELAAAWAGHLAGVYTSAPRGVTGHTGHGGTYPTECPNPSKTQ